jgi:hypothetical protein
MDGSRRSRRLAVAGVAAFAAALALAVGGTWLGATAAALAGLLCWIRAVRAALAPSPAAEGAPRVDASSLGLQGAVATDLLLANAWVATAWVRRVPALARAAADVDAALARWRERGWLDHPERAHALPPPLEKPHSETRAIAGGGNAELLTFASEYECADGEIASAYCDRVANRDARVLLWRHRNGLPRPTLISIHGFGMGRLASDVPWLRVRGWDLVGMHRDLGLDVAYVVLPFHGPRTEGASGTGFFDAHPLFAAAAVAQAVWEVRRLAGWLRGQGAPAIGVHGISLGGCVAALYASLDGALASAIPMTPAVDLPEIFWRHLPESRRREWRAVGLGPERLAEAWSLVAPLRLKPKAPPAARLLVASAADQVTPPAEVRALWSHWGEPAIHWLPGAHLVWRGRVGLASRIEEHLRATLLAANPPAAPSLSRFRA